MRHASFLLVALLLEPESCFALPWSKDGIVHWLLERQGGINNVIAHTESSVPVLDLNSLLATSTSGTSSPPFAASTSVIVGIAHTEYALTSSPANGNGKSPGIAHTEDPVSTTLAGNSGVESVHTEDPAPTQASGGGKGDQTAHTEEQPSTPTTNRASHATVNVPHVESTPNAPPRVTPAPSAHIESPTPATTTPAYSRPTQASSSPSSGGTSESDSGKSNTGSSEPSQPADQESSSGEDSPDLGAPGSQSWAAPAPAPEISSAPPVAVAGSAGSFNFGSATVAFSAIPGKAGSPDVSAVVVAGQTATPGQTLTINSQEVVVSASGSSLYFAPVITVVPEPAPSSITKVWTEGGGKVVTGVFAAPSGGAAGSNDAAPTKTASGAKQAQVTAAAEAASSALPSPTTTGGVSSLASTTATPSSNSGSGSGTSSTAAPTGDASRALRSLSGALVATVAGLMLVVLL